MMTICVRTFKYINEAQDSTVKQSGWRLENTPDFDPMCLGYGVVHDAIEHYEEGEAGIENEMMAFGSIYHIRVQGKWWEQFGVGIDADKMMAWDIARFLHEQNFDVKPLPFKDDEIDKALKKFFVAARAHYAERLINFHLIPADTQTMEAFDSACAWMQLGYIRSVNRWNGRRPKVLTKFFNSLTKLVDNLNCTIHDSTLKVIFDTKTLDHQVFVC